MWAVLRFWMYSQVEASGVRKRFWDWALPEICNGPNRSVAPACRGNPPPPPATRPARKINPRRRYVMPAVGARARAASEMNRPLAWSRLVAWSDLGSQARIALREPRPAVLARGVPDQLVPSRHAKQ